MKDHVAVLVPCYNESKTIEKVVRDFKRVLPEATVYVYDNNSSDGTLPAPAPSFAGSGCKAREVSFAGCSGRSTRIAT